MFVVFVNKVREFQLIHSWLLVFII